MLCLLIADHCLTYGISGSVFRRSTVEVISKSGELCLGTFHETPCSGWCVAAVRIVTLIVECHACMSHRYVTSHELRTWFPRNTIFGFWRTVFFLYNNLNTLNTIYCFNWDHSNQNFPLAFCLHPFNPNIDHCNQCKYLIQGFRTGYFHRSHASRWWFSFF